MMEAGKSEVGRLIYLCYSLGLGLLCLTALLTTFQLYRGVHAVLLMEET
jgi:hypothetical protein